MLAAVAESLGSEPRLGVREVPDPQPGPGESLVAIQAASVAPFELTVLGGELFGPPPLPFITGTEGAGTIVSSPTYPAGARVRVSGGGIGISRAGLWAELVAAPDTSLEPVPDGVDIGTAASYLTPATTALAALRVVGAMRPGDKVGVTGATGAVGSVTMQLALREGAGRVVGFLRDPDNAHLLPGGVEPVVWNGAETAERFGDDKALDLLVDIVGGPNLASLAIGTVKPGGSVALVGYSAGEELRVSLPELLVADVSLKPVNGVRIEDKVLPAARALLPEFDNGLELRTKRLPLSEIESALDQVRLGTAGARLLIEP